MKRVLIDTTGIKVSAPGTDVDTATIDQLLLYIGARNSQILYSGFLTIYGTGSQAATISFPSLPSNPEAIFYVTMYSGSGTTNFIPYTGYLLYSGNQLGQPYNYTYVKGEFSNSSLQLTVYGVNFTSAGVRYLIFRKPLAA